MNTTETPRVLIVDDNLVNQKVISFAIQKLGWPFDMAANGKLALEKYRQEPYSLVLMDIMMPVMDGLECTRKIRDFERQKGLRPAVIIAVSANFFEEQRQEYLSYGLDDILLKPVDFQLLEKTIKKYLHP